MSVQARLGLLLPVALACALTALFPGTPAFAMTGGDEPLRVKPVLPGQVITVAMPLPRYNGTGVARYVITPSPTVRLFGAATGTLAVTPASDLVVPITAALARDQQSGALSIATIVVTWPDGTQWRNEIVTTVLSSRKLVTRVQTTEAWTAPGRPTSLQYLVENQGNAVDTVAISLLLPIGWETKRPLQKIVIGRGLTATGTLSLTPPADARRDNYPVTFVAMSLADTAMSNTTILVSNGVSGHPAYTQMPLDLFVGAMDVSERPTANTTAFALSGSADLDGETQLRFAYHRRTPGAQATPFYRYTSGPDMLLSLRRGGVGIIAGDVQSGTGRLSGLTTSGRGFSTNIGTHGYDAQFTLARPRSGTAVDDGHIAQSRFGLHTSFGVLSASYANVARTAFPGGGFDEHQSATMGYAGSTEHHSIEVEGGWFSVKGPDAVADAGAALDAVYRYANGEASILAGVRRVPGMLRGAGGAHDEMSISAALPLAGRLGFMGWATQSSMPILAAYTLDTRSASAGLRYTGSALRGSLRAGLVHTGGFQDAAASDQRSVTGSISAQAGSFSLLVNTEAGVIQSDTVRSTLANYSVGLVWRSDQRSAWLNGVHGQGRYGETPWHLDFGTDMRVGRVDLQAGGNTEFGSRSLKQSTSWWFSTTTRIISSASLVLGTEYQPWRNGSPLRASAGVRMRFGVPVPSIPGSRMSGVVFDDVNGNGVRDEGEPGLSAVALHLAPDRATTDLGGRFSLPKGDRAEVILDAASLPAGFIAPPFRLQPRGEMTIPLVRVAKLVIQLSESGADTLALRPASGLYLTLTDANGRTRDAIASDDGVVTFAALGPGIYTVTVTPVNARGDALPPKTATVSIVAGVGQSIRIMVPSRMLELRMNDMGNSNNSKNNKGPTKRN